MVVDHNQTSQSLLAELLGFFAFKVQAEESFEEALAELEYAAGDQPFALVMMNWIMPGQDGLDAARKLRDNYRFKDLPIIILSKVASRSNGVDRFELLDNVAFLQKPVTPSSVLEALKESINGAPASDSGQTVKTEPAGEADPGKIRGAHILLVEDNPVNLQVAVEILTKEGFSVDVAVDGRQAIEKVLVKKYDCVLMDVEMPGMDGHEATRLIRTKLGLVDLPIIAMTAHTLKGDREKCLEAGMNDYLPKPVGTKQLFAALVKWIKPGPDLGTKIGPEKPPREKRDDDLFLALPGFDLKSALDRIEGHTDIYKKILKEFSQEFGSAGARMRQSFSIGDLETCRRLAHNLKGGAGNIGAADLFGAASDLLISLRQGQVQQMENILDKLEGQLENVINLISRLDTG
jgi:CheY-like chemotaxis protein